MQPRLALFVLIFGSLVAALMLAIAPLPPWAVHYRPLWVPLTVTFWLVTQPKHVNLGTAWVMGLLEDVALGSSLGQHALAMILLGFAAVRLHKQFQLFSMLQQSLLILLGLAIYMALVLWLDGIRGEAPAAILYWRPLLTSVLLWPWLYAVLETWHRRIVGGAA